MRPEKQAEIYHSLGTSTWNAAYEITQRNLVQRQLAPTYEVPEEEATRVQELANLGLEYIEQALALEPEYADALSYKNLLLRELVKVESDSDVKRQLLEEANEVRRLAMELLKQRRQQERQLPPNGSGGAMGEPATLLSPAKTLVAPPPPPPSDELTTCPQRVSGRVLQENAIFKVQPA